MSYEKHSQNGKYYGKVILREEKYRESSGIVQNHLENKGHIMLSYSDSVSQRYL